MLESLSSRRAWIEIIEYEKDNSTGTVALLTESVDRNRLNVSSVIHKYVALLTESVDRNSCGNDRVGPSRRSLSSRRAWIEILLAYSTTIQGTVALLTESVDRNQ